MKAWEWKARRERILEYLRTNGEATTKELAQMFDYLYASNIYGVLRKMEKDGLLKSRLETFRIKDANGIESTRLMRVWSLA